MAGTVRQSLDVNALERYLDEHVKYIETPISIKQFGYGQSNPTYMITAHDGARFVLRKKPPGKLLSKTAHQVEREYRILHALRDTDVPVPKAHCLCEDASIVGTPFYIMEYLQGRIFEDPSFPGVSPDERHLMWRSAISTLAKLHLIDAKEIGLEDFGRAANFYNRQIKTLSVVSNAQAETIDLKTKKKVGPIPHFGDMVKFFGDPRTQPKDRSSLIHGDYKIDNLVYHTHEPRVVGILDWEMSTIGHPLSDLSNLISPFALALGSSFPGLRSRVNTSFAAEAHPEGLPSRNQCLEWYEASAKWDPRAEASWGDCFGLFRNSVIMQGIAARFALGQASSTKAKEYASQTKPFGDFTWSLVEKLQADPVRTSAKL